MCYNAGAMDHLFEGAISTKAVLQSGKRKVSRVLIDKEKSSRDISFILTLAREKEVEIERVKREEIDALTEGNTHGGIICYAEERSYSSLEDFKGRSFLALLEGIEDPFNFGYCLRSLKAFGCEGILVSERNWYSAAGAIARSSAGASEWLDVVQVSDWNQALKELRKEYKVVSANRRNAIPLVEADLKEPLIIAIGGEKRGLSRAVEENTDVNVYIPYAGDFRNALNASAAAAVFGYEVMRQKGCLK